MAVGGGGVGLCVPDSFNVEILAGSEPLYDNTPEFIICEIKKDQLKLLFATVYRRPHAAYPINFFNCLANYLPHFTSIIITGDLTINMAFPESPAATYLNNTISANSPSLVPSDPTHHQLWRDSHTLIDLFIVGNLDCLQSCSKSSAPFIARHDFIEIALACNKLPPVERSIQSRDLKGVNPETLCQALSHHLPTSDPTHPSLSIIS